MASQSALKVVPLAAGLGAAIHGADVAGPRADEDFELIRAAFIEHGVVFLRGLELTPEQQLSIARRLGDINVNRFFQPVPEAPEVALVLKEPDQVLNIGGGWHTDHSYDQIPALGSLLYARELPSSGGDTLFSSMYRAYDALSPALQATLRTLEADHSSRHVFGRQDAASEKLKGRIGNAEAGDPGCTSSRGHQAPAQRSPRVVCEPVVHRRLVWLDAGRVTASAPVSVQACAESRVHLSLALAGWRSGDLGQSGHLALCAQ